jgi:hypothetical protein
MMTLACFWLLTFALFLEACHRAPLVEEFD